MERELRTIARDDALRLEAYRLEGVVRRFPNHFHEYYVIGLIERGARKLCCKGRERAVSEGDILLFNPGDAHGCVQSGDGALDYRGLNIAREVMLDWTAEATGRRELPEFSQSVVRDEALAHALRDLHQQVMDGTGALRGRESLRLLSSRLIAHCAQLPEGRIPQFREEIDAACSFMEAHYAERITLDQICRHAGASKATLLRAFSRARGVTPYLYLENIRVGRARELLAQGVPPVEAALRTGFSDQSHLTNAFRRYTGFPPGAYRETCAEAADSEPSPNSLPEADAR